jgi:HrpA-like RNA helicase
MRAETCVGPTTRLEVVTEGILTRMLQNDPELTGVGLVILDEFHERSLQADLALALLLDSRGCATISGCLLCRPRWITSGYSRLA